MPRRSSFSPAFKIALICLPIFIGALDLTVVSAVLPHVILDLEIPLQTGLDNAAWLVTGYLLAYSISMTFMGRLSDLHGRRRVFLTALVIFAIGSYLVAVADTWPTHLVLRIYYLFFAGRPDLSFTTLYVLIGARMVQAFGAGSMVPVGMAMVGDLFPPGSRARPLGLIAAVDTAGWVVGHLYGGIVVRYFDWRTIFWLNLPLCLLAYVLIAALLHDPPGPQSKGKMDWWGAGLIAVALTLLNLALGSSAETSAPASFDQQNPISQLALPLLALAGITFLAFLWRQARARYPLVDLSLFKRPNFLPASLANFLLGVAMFIAIANVPLFINSLIAATPNQGAWDSGWVLSALTVPMALAAVVGGWVTERRGYRLPLTLGAFLAVVGFGLMTGWTHLTSYASMVPQLTLTGIGFGLSMAPVTTAVINASPTQSRGTSSALLIIFRLVGMTLGVSGITAYDLQRADILRQSLATQPTELTALANAGALIVEKVISETFLIAGAVTALVLLTVFFIRKRAI